MWLVILAVRCENFRISGYLNPDPWPFHSTVVSVALISETSGKTVAFGGVNIRISPRFLSGNSRSSSPLDFRLKNHSISISQSIVMIEMPRYATAEMWPESRNWCCSPMFHCPRIQKSKMSKAIIPNKNGSFVWAVISGSGALCGVRAVPRSGFRSYEISSRRSPHKLARQAQLSEYLRNACRG